MLFRSQAVHELTMMNSLYKLRLTQGEVNLSRQKSSKKRLTDAPLCYSCGLKIRKENGDG